MQKGEVNAGGGEKEGEKGEERGQTGVQKGEMNAGSGRRKAKKEEKRGQTGVHGKKWLKDGKMWYFDYRFLPVSMVQ